MSRTWFQLLLRPAHPDRVLALGNRFAELPVAQRNENQAIGRYIVACGATHGVHEACNFGCTACYLAKEANHQPPLPFAKVQEQLRAMRSYLGPGGNVQLTSGEVTLLPADALGRIVAEAVKLDLSPMVMTHGDVVLHDSDYLDHLVAQGLRKISLHVDTTQRGRIGLSRSDSEIELNQVRDNLANMLRDCRRRTGVRLKSATTLTVNRHNLRQLEQVVHWFLNNLDCFRILSLQPQAKTGRTRNDDGVGAAEVHEVLEKAMGMKLTEHAFEFGHKACTRITFFMALLTHREPIMLQAVRPDQPMDRELINSFMRDFSGCLFNDRPTGEMVLSGLGILLRKPQWLWRGLRYGVLRSWQERRHIPKVLGAILRGKLRIHRFAFVTHAFMSPETLATSEGQDRLAACAFKLPVDGRMVSMCEMNATELRQDTYVV